MVKKERRGRKVKAGQGKSSCVTPSLHRHTAHSRQAPLALTNHCSQLIF